jgi:hypothetical protein
LTIIKWVIHAEKPSPGRCANSAANPLPTSQIPLPVIPPNCSQSYDILWIFVADRAILRRGIGFLPEGRDIEHGSRRRV